MINEIIISSAAIVAVLGVLFFVFKKRIFDYFTSFSEKIAENNLKALEERNKQILKEERERFMELSDEKMKRNEQNLEGKKNLIKEMVEKIDSELRDSQKKIEILERDRIGEFSKMKTILEEHKNITGELKNSTDNLKNILSNNQLRGKYGEEVAENLLKIAGFMKGVNYDSNLSQEMNANRPDFTIYLPDRSKVNIDVKFPYSNLQKYQEVKSEKEKREYFAKFKTDVKQKIKQITSRDYINLEEKTLNFVILFVPNEMIFSVINDKLYDIVEEANEKKVAIVGPISFITFLRIIHQSYDNFRIQEDLHRVVNLIGKFKQEFSKYSDEFDRLGDRINSMSKQYDSLATTRTRQLTKIIDQISDKDIKIIEEKEVKKLETGN